MDLEVCGVLAVGYAMQDLGVPYHWGGDNPLDGGLDCSGSVLRWWRFAMPGVEVGDAGAAWLFDHLEVIEREEARAGDLSFYGNTSGKVNHVMMVVCPAKRMLIGASGGGKPWPGELTRNYKMRMLERDACVKTKVGYDYRPVLGFRRVTGPITP